MSAFLQRNLRLLLKFSLLISHLTGGVRIPDARSEARQDTFKAPGTIPGFTEILEEFHGSYSVSWMGPRLNGSLNETYNVYLPDVSSVQFFHSLQLGYSVNPHLQIGLGADVVQNLNDGVVGETGVIHHRSSEWYDPYVYFNFPDWIQLRGVSVSTGAS